MLSRRRALGLAVAGIALGTGLLSGWPTLRWRIWERALEDQLHGLRGARPVPPDLVVVAIDDATLQQGAWFERSPAIPAWARGVGTLPWPRAAYGRLAEHLLEAGAAAVAINVVFEGPSSAGPADDAALGAILQRHRGRIVLAAEMLEAGDARGAGSLTLVRPDPAPELAAGGPALGLTNLPWRGPGEPQRHPQAYGAALADQGVEAPPSLPLALLAAAGRTSRQADAVTELSTYGPEGSFQRLSAWEVLDPERWRSHPQRPALRGALAVVGPVVAQGDDGYPTPFGPLSGLELVATASANSLQGVGLYPWPSRPPLRALLAGLVVLAVGLAALGRAGLGWRLAVVGLALALQVAAGVVAAERLHRWLPLLGPAGGLALLALVFGADAYLWEEGERRRLRRTFERYVAPGVVAEILADPAAAQGVLRGRSLDVTVLFSDLQGFTALTRQRSAEGRSEEHVRQLNAYLGAMVEVITAHGGTVDKFIGDAVMAVFGSPVGRGVQQEARAALACALAMGEALEELNARWRREGVQPLASGIGLASGTAVVGQIGSPRRLDFTVIGDPVNRAARLESLTRSLEVSLLFDGATAERISGAFAWTPLPHGSHPIKGLGEVEVFSPPAGLLAPGR